MGEVTTLPLGDLRVSFQKNDKTEEAIPNE